MMGLTLLYIFLFTPAIYLPLLFLFLFEEFWSPAFIAIFCYHLEQAISSKSHSVVMPALLFCFQFADSAINFIILLPTQFRYF